VISSANNPTIRRTRRLRKRAERERRRAFIVEGHRAVRVAVERGHRLELVLHTPVASERHRRLLLDAADAGAQLAEAAPSVLAGLSAAANAPDVVAVARMPSPAGAGGGPVLILAGVRDPATAGALLASAAASGVTRAVAVRGTADLFASTPVRTAAGAHFVLSLAEAATIEESVAGLKPVIALGDDGPAPWTVDLRGAPAFVIGDQPSEVYDARVAVPCGQGGASAPLAARGAVVMFEAKRQREAG
jgi:RNA methyltransferase, TrmH family